jgi:Leucine-rich repeat (LRR) protein
MFFSIVCFIVFALSVLVTFVLTAMKPKQVVPAFLSTNDTNTSWNLTEMKLARYHKFLSMILDWNVTSQDRLENDMDPAAKALYWLALSERENETVEALRTRFSLAALYFSTHGKDSTSTWHQESHWMSPDSVCTWYGVECLTFPGVPHNDESIRTLNLSGNALDGSIPPEITLLQLGLRSLDLSSNLLGGSIPNVHGLRNLRKLILSHNFLTSSIPDSLYQLSQLLHLKLNDCLLTGTISSDISHLSKLRGLELQNNVLNGSVSEMFGRMSSLRLLYLDGNELSGTIPSTLPRHIMDLRLSRNQLHGSIPVEVANSPHLRVLHLDSNELTGKCTAC